MDTNTIAANFEPLSDFVHEEDCDTLLLHLPGFTKEQLRVQLARSGVLKISGTRDNKWSRFQKDFPVPVNCDTTKITAKFEDGILYVRQPKAIVPDKKPTQISPETPKTNHEGPHKSTPEKPVPNQEVVDKSSDDTPGTTAGTDKREKVQSGAELANKRTFDIAKLLEETKLKVMRKKMTRVMVVLFAFVLGMCINKLQAWFY